MAWQSPSITLFSHDKESHVFNTIRGPDEGWPLQEEVVFFLKICKDAFSTGVPL